MNAAANRNDLNATEHWFQVALTKGIQPDSAMLTLADVTQSSSDIGFWRPPIGVSRFIYALVISPMENEPLVDDFPIFSHSSMN
jgi:hypothetical protein